ncbi:MAG: Hsp70 family protein [Deferrisomatales bacterium]
MSGSAEGSGTPRPRYWIGIDLGTTNSVLAYVEAGGARRRPQVLSVPQWDTPGAAVDSPTLPSFCYWATEAERAAGFGADGPAPAPERGWLAGRFARAQMALNPGRVIHSAKSWLCHGEVDRTGPILPWRSEEVPPAERLSPVQASAAYLAHFRRVWDRTVAREDPEAAFDRQQVVVTVPASFDEVAQQLTVEAARLAGFPDAVRLLEEPQAAFYYWLGTGAHASELADVLEQAPNRTARVLVCDIGGGTTDLSLFEVRGAPGSSTGLDLRRIAVSEHLLLGGDNIDLTLAYLLEHKLTSGEAKLTGKQWSRLLFQARELKERVLGGADGPDAEYPVTLPGAGSGLFASTLSTRITAAEVRGCVLEGFFPECGPEARPSRRTGGLKEWGLPFAADTAVTRHLADFLEGRAVDAVLFNGGTVSPAFLRERLTALLARWQGGRAPAVLTNDDMALAVARGAAHYAHLLGDPEAGQRIAGGHAHALYLEVFRRKGKQRSLVCLLPKGMEANEAVAIEGERFDLLVNQPVRFQCHSSSRRTGDAAGAVVPWNDRDFHPLPPLQTAIHLAADRPRPANNRIRVTLEGALNEVGLLQVHCVEVGTGSRWRLDFNLRRGVEDDDRARPADAPLAAPEKLERAHALIRSLYGKKKDPTLPEVKPRQLVRRIEEALGQPRQSWDTVTLRTLWPPLAQGMTRKNRSVDHEEAWLLLAGYVLRPGYGVELDESRMEELWRLHSVGMGFPKEKRIQAQWALLWRRTAGGLNAARQEKVCRKAIQQIRGGSAGVTAETIHLVGAMERLPLEVKLELAQAMAAVLRKNKPGHKAPHAWALGRLLTRTPLYAGPDAILPPRVVEELFESVRDLDWTAPAHAELTGVFAQIARRTDRRDVDVSPEAREQIARKMEQSRARPEQVRVVREVVPLDLQDRVRQFGESLPSGLVLV